MTNNTPSPAPTNAEMHDPNTSVESHISPLVSGSTISEVLVEGTPTALDVEAPSPEDNPTTTGVTLTEFHFFPKLPAELRVKIWKLTEPGPRLVRIQSVSPYRISQIYKNITQPPAPLFVCQESRIEYLKTFHQLITGSNTDGTSSGISFYLSDFAFGIRTGDHTKEHWTAFAHPSAIYFNPLLDTFEAPKFCFFALLQNQRTLIPPALNHIYPNFCTEGIKRLRLDVTPWTSWGIEDLLYHIPQVFQDIETVTLYVKIGIPPICPNNKWARILDGANQKIDAACDKWQSIPKCQRGLAHRWQIFPFDKDFNITPAPPKLPYYEYLSFSEHLSSIESTLTQPKYSAPGIKPFTRHLTMEILFSAIPYNGITVKDLAEYLHRGIYGDNPLSDKVSSIFAAGFNKDVVWKNWFTLDENGLLRRQGDIKLILEWA